MPTMFNLSIWIYKQMRLQISINLFASPQYIIILIICFKFISNELITNVYVTNVLVVSPTPEPFLHSLDKWQIGDVIWQPLEHQVGVVKNHEERKNP